MFKISIKHTYKRFCADYDENDATYKITPLQLIIKTTIRVNYTRRQTICLWCRLKVVLARGRLRMSPKRGIRWVPGVRVLGRIDWRMNRGHEVWGIVRKDLVDRLIHEMGLIGRLAEIFRLTLRGRVRWILRSAGLSTVTRSLELVVLKNKKNMLIIRQRWSSFCCSSLSNKAKHCCS